MNNVMKLLKTILFLGIFVFAAPAEATVEEAWKLPAERAARAYWGGDPPCGVPTVDYNWSNGLNGGFAYPSSCHIQIDSSQAWTWTYFCAVMVHEWGHIFGYGHAPGTVMDADVYYPNLIPLCRHNNPKGGLVIGRLGLRRHIRLRLEEKHVITRNYNVNGGLKP